MLLYRVFPWLPGAAAGDAGHPLYVQAAGQGRGRWDNPNLYTTMYLSLSPEAAIGETFGNLARWSPKMFNFPVLPGSAKSLGTFELDEETHPLLEVESQLVVYGRRVS